MAAINTLEKIRWERKRVQKELKRLEQSIAEDFNELTAPPQPPIINLNRWLTSLLGHGVSLTAQ